ncbi:MAG: hypothetical protein JW720_01460 [Sedimentisphaerales bacterium]|nr:hypothetical protein [Sedimentisphaerales bacterium]
MQKLTQRDIRILKIGGICAAGILIFFFGSSWLEHWSDVRAKISLKQAQLKSINVSESKVGGVMSIVPAFEMPDREEAQKNLFRGKLVDQLKKAGVKYEPLKVVTSKKTFYKSFKLMTIQCKAKCNFTQALDLLAGLNENPYLVGVESFKMTCDKNKPQEVELDMMVSTVYRSG